jgi:hypothetical protein
VITLTPVLERVAASLVPTYPWQVTDQDTGWLRVHTAMSPHEVGMAMYSLAFHTCGDDVPTTVAAALAVVTGPDDLYVPGGLLLHDPSTGVTVEPGCCCGLFEWRDWLGVLDGQAVWFGHDPTPGVEHLDGGGVRVWVDAEYRERGHVDLDRDQLAGLLVSAQQDLVGFLSAVRAWVQDLVPERVAQLVGAVDAGLSVSAPLR